MITFCIPNYNYGNYMDQTLDSLHQQINKNFEIVISDNASSDNSIDVIIKWSTKFNKFKFRINNTNVGFGGNLDRAAEIAEGDYLIMLSSDDLVHKDATKVYEQFIEQVNVLYTDEKFFFGGQPLMIDSEGSYLKHLEKGNNLWLDSDLDETLTKRMGFKVYKVASAEMLKRCILQFKTPLHFITVCYPKSVYRKIEGYGGARLYNPDKWFNWKLLNSTDYIYYLDNPLFSYRWHANNQANQQQQDQILKYWMDEYRNCFELSEEQLNKASLKLEDVKKAFVRHCILPHVYQNRKKGNKLLARRILYFGLAAYPKTMLKNKLFYPLWLMTRL